VPASSDWSCVVTDPEAWDEADINPSLGSHAFVLFACALVWLLTAPFQLIANLNRRDHATQNDAGSADCDAGVEASSIHSGGN
jgi:hypothetical protein